MMINSNKRNPYGFHMRMYVRVKRTYASVQCLVKSGKKQPNTYGCREFAWQMCARAESVWRTLPRWMAFVRSANANKISIHIYATLENGKCRMNVLEY